MKLLVGTIAMLVALRIDGYAALIPLPADGSQVNADAAASIDPKQNAGVIDVAGGTLTAGQVPTPLAALRAFRAAGLAAAVSVGIVPASSTAAPTTAPLPPALERLAATLPDALGWIDDLRGLGGNAMPSRPEIARCRRRVARAVSDRARGRRARGPRCAGFFQAMASGLESRATTGGDDDPLAVGPSLAGRFALLCRAADRAARHA